LELIKGITQINR